MVKSLWGYTVLSNVAVCWYTRRHAAACAAGTWLINKMRRQRWVLGFSWRAAGPWALHAAYSTISSGQSQRLGTGARSTCEAVGTVLHLMGKVSHT